MLAEEFVASKFDQKHLIQIICTTQAYQRSSQTTAANNDDVEQYSHMAMKVLPPRSLFRSYGVATANQISVPEDVVPNGKPGKQDGAADGLAFFDSREYDESPGEYAYGVPQLLRLINTKLPPACDRAAKSAARRSAKEKVIEHLYLAALTRFPTHKEAKAMSEFVAKQGGDVKGYSAALWVLLNSAEFVNNH